MGQLFKASKRRTFFKPAAVQSAAGPGSHCGRRHGDLRPVGVSIGGCPGYSAIDSCISHPLHGEDL